MYRMLLEIWTLKVIMMRYQTEMKLFLDNREKAILMIKW